MASAPQITAASSHHHTSHRQRQQQEEEFVRTWTPPTPQTSISSQVRAVVEETGLTSSQVQYVTDWYRHRHRRDITLKALLDECDKYQGGQKVFPEKVLHQNASSSSLSGGGGGGGGGGANPNTGSGVFATAAAASSLSQQPIRSRSSAIVDEVDGPPDSGFGGAENDDEPPDAADEQADSVPSVQTTSSVSTAATRSPPRRNGTGRGRSKEQSAAPPSARRTSASSMMDDDNAIRVDRMSPMERERWILKNVLLALQREREILDEARKCTSCKTRVRDITFLPCGHFTMCKTCSEPIYECPTCQRDILATAQTFLS